MPGLILAIQLARTLGPNSVRIVEKHPKSDQDQYGRAITLFPRTSEMLDQLGLADALAQQCFACRTTVSYDRHGNEVKGRGWHFMESMKDTVWDFALVLRQKYQEEIFRHVLTAEGVTLEAPVALTDVIVDESWPLGDYRVTATLKDGTTGKTSTVKCKYLVGADGGRSFVRRAFNIPFDGSSSEDKWVRVDGVIETDLPKPRSYCAIESPTHGNVLWAALDHGATRIGYAFTKDREKAYEDFNEAAAVQEAIAAVKPFNLRFKQVDWWTVYVVGQRIARSFFTKGCIFLAGDACHTHSSGAAQGMNTGIHDAVNLAWKLSLVLRGHARPELLQTYEAERRPNVEKLINYDKDISRLMTMQLPLGWKGDPDTDPNEVLGVVMAEAATFSSGLGIGYEIDEMLSVPGSWSWGSTNGAVASDLPGKSFDAVSAGRRVPDVALQKPGTLESTRLHRETPNTGVFHIAIFAGRIEVTGTRLKEIYDLLAGSSFFSDHSLPLSWLTISMSVGPSVVEVLGCTPLGKIFYDTAAVAHDRFGVQPDEGAVFVLRPDGWIGTSVRLAGSSVAELQLYFERFLLSPT